VAKPEYVFKKTAAFKKAFEDLSEDNQGAANAAFKVFKINPFDMSLKTHKINRLSSLVGTTVYSVVIKGNLRSLFIIDGNQIVSFDIGTHDIYK
jgi:hypothetical protein